MNIVKRNRFEIGIYIRKIRTGMHFIPTENAEYILPWEDKFISQIIDYLDSFKKQIQIWITCNNIIIKFSEYVFNYIHLYDPISKTIVDRSNGYSIDDNLIWTTKSIFGDQVFRDIMDSNRKLYCQHCGKSFIREVISKHEYIVLSIVNKKIHIYLCERCNQKYIDEIINFKRYK